MNHIREALEGMLNNDGFDGHYEVDKLVKARTKVNDILTALRTGKLVVVDGERLSPPHYCNFCPHNENCQVPRFKTAGQYGFRHLATPNRVLWSNTNDKECRESYIAYLQGEMTPDTDYQDEIDAETAGDWKAHEELDRLALEKLDGE